MEDDLNFFENGIRPYFLAQWKINSIFGYIEDDLHFLAKWKTTFIFGQNGRRLNLKHNNTNCGLIRRRKMGCHLKENRTLPDNLGPPSQPLSNIHNPSST